MRDNIKDSAKSPDSPSADEIEKAKGIGAASMTDGFPTCTMTDALALVRQSVAKGAPATKGGKKKPEDVKPPAEAQAPSAKGAKAAASDPIDVFKQDRSKMKGKELQSAIDRLFNRQIHCSELYKDEFQIGRSAYVEAFLSNLIRKQCEKAAQYAIDSVGSDVGQQVCPFYGTRKGCFKADRCPMLHVDAPPRPVENTPRQKRREVQEETPLPKRARRGSADSASSAGPANAPSAFDRVFAMVDKFLGREAL